MLLSRAIIFYLSSITSRACDMHGDKFEVEEGIDRYEGKNEYLADLHSAGGFTDFLYWSYRIFHDLYGER